jgi:hypothetical protein
MDIDSLVAVGLTAPQASAYALLIEHGSVKPPLAAKELGMTRSNAYKILDKLVELRLATKHDVANKVSYLPAHPIALSDLAARYRAETAVREEAAHRAIQALQARYSEHTDKPNISTASGKIAVAEMYRQQINLREDIHFIRTRSDIPAMGFDTMHNIRTTPARFGLQRRAIMTAPTEDAKIDYAQHNRSNLDITWAEHASYTAPVEWSVTKSSLLIVTYASEPHAILIIDPSIATAFLQLWSMLQALLQTQPTHRHWSEQAE